MINHKYAVETKFFDSGWIEIGIIEKVDFSNVSRTEEKEKYDYYYTVFNTLKEAKEYIDKCMLERYCN